MFRGAHNSRPQLAGHGIDGTICRLDWRGGRVVDGSGLENRQGASPRGFESHPLRCPRKGDRREVISDRLNRQIQLRNVDSGLKASEQRATHKSRPES
jgi:hypothetical protein